MEVEKIKVLKTKSPNDQKLFDYLVTDSFLEIFLVKKIIMCA